MQAVLAVRRYFARQVRRLTGMSALRAEMSSGQASVDRALGEMDRKLSELFIKQDALVAAMKCLAKIEAAPKGLTKEAPAILARLDEIASSNRIDHEKLLHQINYTNHNLYLHLKEAMRVRELYYRDVMLTLDRAVGIYPRTKTTFCADAPIAIDTDDHLKPWGAAHDNTRSPRFAAACEKIFRRPLTLLDLGCSGGGLVLDFILRGHSAYGVEGSDYPLRAQRAEWRVLRNNLFTADITKRFRFREMGSDAPIACDVITMWEVLEHISDADLPQLFDNVKAHLKPDGIFVGSIALVPDDHHGASYHRTVKSRGWWEERFISLGIPMVKQHGLEFEDFCRGTSNGPIDENYRENPEMGFHFVAMRNNLI